jgi:RNA-directed DNA polymerase
MWQIFEKEIERKARSILAKQARKQNASLKYASKFTRRTGMASNAAPYSDPTHWDFDKHFDPIYCISHSRFLAKRIWVSIQNGAYQPKPAIQFEIEKPDGGIRTIMSFTIPDSAVANVFHRRLTERNKGLFSSYSFAYRPDKTVFEAIIHLQRMIQPSKSYVLQYDYSKYFDTIEHSYLNKLIDQQTFVMSVAERHLIQSFLCHQYASVSSYQTRNFKVRDKGVPQGSSLSLFLSNIAAHELDMRLERSNGSFVRFADDVIAVAHSYGDARNIELEFRAHCERSGVKINFDKSSGISLLAGRASDDERRFFLDKDDGAELKNLKEINFLGHQVSSSQVNLTNKAVKRIKRRLSRIIYVHMLQYPRRGHPINPNRIDTGCHDWDLVTCINEIRRYIYGGLKERSIHRFLDEDIKLPHVRGLMAFYALVNTIDTLKELDGWLLDVLRRAIKQRNILIGQQSGLTSYTIGESELISGDWYSNLIPNETGLPSFVRGWRAARKFYKRYGLSEVEAPSYYAILSLYG